MPDQRAMLLLRLAAPPRRVEPLPSRQKYRLGAPRGRCPRAASPKAATRRDPRSLAAAPARWLAHGRLPVSAPSPPLLPWARA